VRRLIKPIAGDKRGMSQVGCIIVDELHDCYSKEEALQALAAMDRKVINDTLRGERVE